MIYDRQPFGTESLSDDVVKAIETTVANKKRTTKEMVVQVN